MNEQVKKLKNDLSMINLILEKPVSINNGKSEN